MRLCTFPPGTAFLPALAALWQNQCELAGTRLHDGLILLPTRRAARALAAAFLTAADGKPLLLPRIVALSGLDEAPLALAGVLSEPPAMPEPRRRAELARLILALRGAAGAPTGSDAAYRLAGELAGLMDEAERAEIDLRTALTDIVAPEYAAHWGQILAFLSIVTKAWPAHLAETGLANPAARQIKLLDAQTKAWTAAPPAHPVLAVAAGADIPAIARLLRRIATLPLGCVVLPGFDADLADSVLPEGHPQAGWQALLPAIGAAPGDVRTVDPRPGTWPAVASQRFAALRTALLPADGLGAWRDFSPAPLPGLTRLIPADQQDEAVAIALILRDALETPHAQAALVTPDRALAGRVAAELGRFGIVADDSAGEALAETPPAVFLRLLAAALAQALAPVALLALLKHPLAACGMAPAALRQAAREFERDGLRGPAPLPGLAGLRQAAARARDDARQLAHAGLILRLEAALEPLLRASSAVAIPPAELLDALIVAAEALATTDITPGPALLWGGEEGEALANLLAEAREALPVLPPDRPDCLAPLLDALLEGAVVRSRRATRGKADGLTSEHPRVFIWGLLEARLQSADVLVLGGLSEGVWPPATDPGPWMSRQMRARAGLASPETTIGQAAADFCFAACAAPTVVLSTPRRRDGAPCVPARWLVRLEALLKPIGGLAPHPATLWAAALDQPEGGPVPAAPPRPVPPLAARPRRLAVTDIATLLRDPYEIYARRILHLRDLDPLEQGTDFRDYGSIVHAGIDAFLREVGLDWPQNAAPGLATRLHQALREAGVRAPLVAWWSPRLARIAAWVDAEERRRRDALALLDLVSECEGDWAIERPGGAFTLSGRADRIERRADGTLAILDYKTGTLPAKTAVESGRAPQLLLEGAMARHGGFGPAVHGEVAELVYWRLSGDHLAGEARAAVSGTAKGIANHIDNAVDAMTALIDHFDDPLTTYPAAVPAPRDRQLPYAQLARTAEWGGARDETEAGDDDAG